MLEVKKRFKKQNYFAEMSRAPVAHPKTLCDFMRPVKFVRVQLAACIRLFQTDRRRSTHLVMHIEVNILFLNGCHDQPSVGALLASSEFPAITTALLASKQWHTSFC
jgi:hypothetical protein